MLDKLPFYGQVLVFCALALAIVVAAYTIWPNLGEMRQQIEEFKDEYAKKEGEIRKGRAAEARLPELEREIEAKKRELSDLEQIDSAAIRFTLAIHSGTASLKPEEALRGLLGEHAARCRVTREDLLVEWNGRLLNPLLAAACDGERAAR